MNFNHSCASVPGTWSIWRFQSVSVSSRGCCERFWTVKIGENFFCHNLKTCPDAKAPREPRGWAVLVPPGYTRGARRCTQFRNLVLSNLLTRRRTNIVASTYFLSPLSSHWLCCWCTASETPSNIMIHQLWAGRKGVLLYTANDVYLFM